MQKKRPLQVGKKYIVKVGFGHAHQQFIRGDARIVDQHIDPPKSGSGIFHQTFGRLQGPRTSACSVMACTPKARQAAAVSSAAAALPA